MIKLIASDVDGTLIPEGGSALHPELLEVIDQLAEKGIRFVAASGRSYVSMVPLFEKLKSDIYYIANNGGVVRYQGKALKAYTIDDQLAQTIIAKFRALKETANVFYLITAEDQEYTECDDPEMISRLRDGYKVNLDLVPDLSAVKNKYVKMSIFFKDTDAGLMREMMQEVCGEDATALVSGEKWIDIVSRQAEKGFALSDLQRDLGITREETMAFGDNYNDISLLLAAEESYAVSQAREEAKKAARYVLPDTTMETVLNVLKELL